MANARHPQRWKIVTCFGFSQMLMIPFCAFFIVLLVTWSISPRFSMLFNVIVAYDIKHRYRLLKESKGDFQNRV